jgi:protein-S-isoprenylcysteine O-methyltransferase Ste14
LIEYLRIFITRVVAVGLIVLVLVSSSGLTGKMPIFSNALYFLGIVLVAVATLGRLWCSLYIAGYKTDILITQGPYSMCRNPLYFFSILGAAGIGFATETTLIPAIIVIAFSIYYPLVIKSEETKLLHLHGAEFSAYMERVPRFFPTISSFVEPDEYTVNPRVYRKHMLDAIWFVLIVGFLKVNSSLHSLDLLPTFFQIY